MKKWILLIGLLTHSSVGWSKELIMECPTHTFTPNTVTKLDTSKPHNSNDLLMIRLDGEWVGMGCGDFYDCKKGDESIVVVWVDKLSTPNRKVKNVYDFKFLDVQTTTYRLNGDFQGTSSKKCEKR